jgi:perosamine synthetase
MAETTTSDAEPEKKRMLPYGRQSVDEDDIAAVVETLRSDWLTTGPKVEEFEKAFADFCGVRHSVAVSSGTAALHCTMHAAGIGSDDEVIVPAMTFAATANAVLYCGGTPVFADVERDTILIDADDVAKKITARTKAIVAVDYAGQPCEYSRLRALAEKHDLKLFADACHALGGALDSCSIGSLADASTFSFHPVKPLTTGEGGMVTTNDEELARCIRVFRNHGITSDHRAREQAGSWFYEMVELGFNYRLSDIACALGKSQLQKVPRWTKRRQKIAALYRALLAEHSEIEPLREREDVSHAYHLFVVRLHGVLASRRAEVFAALRAQGVGVQVHYIPVYWHPFYRENFGCQKGFCPVAEDAYESLLSLPIFPAMSDDNVANVVMTLQKVLKFFQS